MQTRRRFVILPLLFLILLLGLAGAACERSPYKQRVKAGLEGEGIPIARADPAYLQYLERKSMLAESVDMARVVSGSQLAWAAGADAPEGLLSYADTWVSFNPMTLLMDSRGGAFDLLGRSEVWTILREVGARGMYVAPLGGAGGIWAKTQGAGFSGEDVVQYDFSQAAGKDPQYRRLIGGVGERTSLLGSDLVPAATGLGPDFFLATRNLREYPGAYCMVDVPKDLWKLLPPSQNEWEGTALPAETVAALHAKGLLPKAMLDETAASGKPSGWAATGEVRGVDATARRWVYRWFINPHHAVLNWEDPSRAAARILSGSAVRQVGMLGQAFIGLRFDAFHGLEPAGGGANPWSIGTAVSAAQSMSREVHRYGGWTWLRDDDLNLEAMRRVLQSDTDFVFDAAFSPAAEHALLTGDATLLRFMGDELLRLRIPAHRLVHVMPAQDGINYALPHLSKLAASAPGAERLRQHTLQAMRAAVAGQNPVPVANNTLYSNGPGLAAMALGLPATAVPADKVAEVAAGHKLLIFFNAMQPGVLMLSGQDLVGALPIAWSSMRDSSAEWNVTDTMRGAYALTTFEENRVVTERGMGKTVSIYGPADVQAHKKESFLRDIGTFLRLRNQIGLSRGTLAARPETKGPGIIALLTRMPGDNGYVLSVCNFGRSPANETISLGNVPGLSKALAAGAVSLGGQGSYSVSGGSVNVALGPWQGRAILLGGRINVVPSAESSSGPEPDVEAPVIPNVPDSPAPAPATASVLTPAPTAPAQQTTTAPEATPAPTAQPAPAAPAPAPLAPTSAPAAAPVPVAIPSPVLAPTPTPEPAPAPAPAPQPAPEPMPTPATVSVSEPAPATQPMAAQLPASAVPAPQPRKIVPDDPPPDLGAIRRREADR